MPNDSISFITKCYTLIHKTRLTKEIFEFTNPDYDKVLFKKEINACLSSHLKHVQSHTVYFFKNKNKHKFLYMQSQLSI